MDLQLLVQQKLSGGDTCTCCILASLVEEGHRQSRLVALIEGQGEFGLFLYTHSHATKSPADLIFDTAFPVTSDFKFTLEAGETAVNHVPVKMAYSSCTFHLELPKTEATRIFLSEVKRAISVQSQNTGFGLPSTFTWMEKYTMIQSNSDTCNPFLDDRFDAVKPQQNAGWPWNQISAADNICPVVDASSATELERSPSLPEIQLQDSLAWSSSSQTSLNESSNNLHCCDTSFKSNKSQSMENLDSALLMGRPAAGGREMLIKRVMKSKEDQYTRQIMFRVFCGTWNVNGKAASEPCHEWLAKDINPPDIYAIGFQELDLSKNAYIFNDSVREEEWYKRVKEALHPGAKYQRVKLIRLVGMMLIVFIKEELKQHVSNLQAATVGTGIMGMLGNKGGVGVRFCLYDTSICFVSSHFAAHIEEVERRNQDFREINSRMNLGNATLPLTISEHDIVFWLGDLNYRLSDIDNESCKQFIEKKDFQKLMDYDQLCRQMSNKKVFLDYVEGNINFVPTYKFDTGTDRYDTSEKCRTPAWCDRILWRGSNIRQLVYRSHMALKLSDHKPVSAVFDTGIKQIDKKRYKQVFEDVMKHLDRQENDFLPQVSLNKMEVHFEDVRFSEPSSETVSVKNTGQVPVKFEFINKLSETAYCKPWLVACPSSAVIQVGDTIDISIEVYVDSKTAAKFNSGEDKLEDILVLHLEGGKDLFISVSGSYIPSVFGVSVEALVHMLQPIREVPVATLVDLEQSSSPPLSPVSTGSAYRPFSVPKEVYRLVDHLFRNGMEEEDLFQIPGSHKEILQIRDSLDTGYPLTIPGSIHSVAEALLIFFESIPEPVIPFSYYNKCVDSCSNYLLCKQVLSQLPQSHHTLFIYICAFLRELLKHSAKNKLDVKFLASQFGALLLRTPPNVVFDQSKRAEERKKAAFMYHFLTNEYDE